MLPVKSNIIPRVEDPICFTLHRYGHVLALAGDLEIPGIDRVHLHPGSQQVGIADPVQAVPVDHDLVSWRLKI